MHQKSKTFGLSLVSGLCQVFLLSACRTSAGSSGLKEDNPAVVECQAAALKVGMTAAESKGLCDKGDVNVSACMVAARETLTAGPGSPAPSSPLTVNQTVTLCAVADVNGGPCITAARKAPFSPVTIQQLCVSVNDQSGPCIAAATRVLAGEPGAQVTPGGPLGAIATGEICKAATVDRIACIDSSRKIGQSAANTYTACIGDKPGAAACLNAAKGLLAKDPTATIKPTGPLFGSTATALCGDSYGEGTASCITATRKAGISDGNIFTICSKSKDPSVASCVNASMRDMKAEAIGTSVPTPPLNSLYIVTLCSQAQMPTGPCIEAARKAVFAPNYIADLCKENHATENSGACIEAAHPRPVDAQTPFTPGLSAAYTVALCVNAPYESAACIEKAKAALKSPEQIVNTCRPPPLPPKATP